MMPIAFSPRIFYKKLDITLIGKLLCRKSQSKRLL